MARTARSALPTGAAPHRASACSRRRRVTVLRRGRRGSGGIDARARGDGGGLLVDRGLERRAAWIHRRDAPTTTAIQAAARRDEGAGQAAQTIAGPHGGGSSGTGPSGSTGARRVGRGRRRGSREGLAMRVRTRATTPRARLRRRGPSRRSSGRARRRQRRGQQQGPDEESGTSTAGDSDGPRPHRAATDRSGLAAPVAARETRRARTTRRATPARRRRRRARQLGMLPGRPTTRRRDEGGTGPNTPGHDDDAPGNSGTAPGQTTATRTETTRRETRATLRARTRTRTTTTRAAAPGARATHRATTTTRLATPAMPPAAPRAARADEGDAAGSSRGRGQSRAARASPRLPGGALLGAHPRNRRCDASRLHPPLRANRAEETATLHASVAAQAVVDRLRPSDLAGPISKGRREELDRILTARCSTRRRPRRRSRQLTAASFPRRRSQVRAPLP